MLRRRLDCSLSPFDAARCLAGAERPFALIGAWAGGGALLGAAPDRVAGPDEDPFALLEGAALVGHPRDGFVGPPTGGAGQPRGRFVGGGWVGYLGYELRHRVERCHPASFDAAPPPPFALAHYDHVVRLDRDGAWWLEALSEAALERGERLAARLGAPPPPRAVCSHGWRMTPDAAGHAALVAACRERIHAGDLFQANVCARLDGRLDGPPLELFARGAEALRPDRAAYLEGPWGAVVSLSPELFLELHGGRVRSAPIKGTRPASRREQLVASSKDRAENTMIVDLMRNDLGRVCVPGSVRVTALAEARAHTGVWHLVSEVEGELGGPGLLRATFPPGSVTGAPKVAAMNVIAELEATPRGVYTGAIGFASPTAGLELNVAIRTFEVRDGRIRLGVGGGVVADSDPEAEAAELAVKAEPLLRAIGATLPAARVRRPRAPLLRAGPVPVPRPDPGAGVYETLLAEDGVAVDLDRHLERLRHSVRALYGIELPVELGDRIAAAAGAGRRRVRVDVAASGAATIAASLVAAAADVALRGWTLPGGLGPHKWADRRLLAALEAASGGAEPLLVDADGALLETARASLLVLGEDGVLRTPWADGRILPGTARARLLAAGEAVEAELGLDDLAAAAAAWVVSALRVRAVTAVDGRALRPLALGAAR